MGYLSFGKTLDMSKATVSLWFRVPQATADPIEQPFSYWDFPVFLATIPLIVFGKQPMVDIYDAEARIVGYHTLSNNQPVYGQFPAGPRQTPSAPSYIGINYFTQRATLEINLQTGDFCDPSQTVFGLVGYEEHIDPSLGVVETNTWADYSYFDSASPEFLGNTLSGAGYPDVSLDVWHHLLLSWDLGSSNSSHGTDASYTDFSTLIDSSSTLYCAIDGNDKSGRDLPALWTTGDPNAMTSYTINLRAGLSTIAANNPANPGVVNKGGGTSPPTVSVNFSRGIQADGIFIPAEPFYGRGIGPAGGSASGAGDHIRPIYRVDMAELMIWSGLVLDSSQTYLFISDRGTPLTQPVSLPVPTVALTGSSQAWIDGKNSGSLTGDFQRVGTIKTFKPDPVIGGGASITPLPP